MTNRKPAVLAPTGELPKRNGHGGARPNTSRKRGHPMMRQEILSLRDRYKLLPLEFFLKVLNQELDRELTDAEGQPILNPDGSKKTRPFNFNERMAAAENAAPYLHSKLASIDVSASMNHTIKHALDLTKLDGPELAMLERIVAKAQIVTLDKNEYEEVGEESSGKDE